MKTNLVPLVLSIVILLFASCKKQDLYSCNSEVNDWAAINQYEYYNAPRAEIIALPLTLQRAIYVSLPSEKKLTLWLEKRQILKKEIGTLLTYEEYQEIEQLFDFLCPDHFDINNMIKYQEFLSYTKEWEAMMRNDYGWDDEKLFYTVCTWMTKPEYYAAMLSEKRVSTTKGGGSGNIGDPTKKECNCRYSVSCGASNICLDNDNQRQCEIIVGCGLIGNSTCTGICDNDLF